MMLPIDVLEEADPKMHRAMTEIEDLTVLDYTEEEKLNYRLVVEYESEEIVILRRSGGYTISSPVDASVRDTDNKRDVTQLIISAFESGESQN